MYQLVKENHFATWNVNRRYEATGTTTAAELEAWFAITRRLLAAASIKVA
jgi:hypothetical protein